MALPGHTPGHTGFVIASGGSRLLAFGDALLSPLQIRHPEWSVIREADPAAAEHHRRALVTELLRPDTLGFGIHFADVVFGRARTDDTATADWHPL